MKRAVISTVVLALCIGVASTKGAQLPPPPAADPFHQPLDQILDVNVRDGFVYYRALQVASAARLDRYVASLNVPPATYDALVARGRRWRSGSTPTTPSCCRPSSTDIRFTAQQRLSRRRASGRFRAPSSS